MTDPPITASESPADQKARILEQYGKKLKARLKKQTDDSPSMKFLNSNFGLFLLSSVFISLFSWGYHQWTTYEAHQREDAKLRQKIGLEVVNRLRYIDKMAGTFEYDDRRVIQQSLFGFDATANVNPSWLRHYSAMFPEFQRRSFTSLLWELEDLSEKDRRPRLQLARTKIGLIEGYLARLQYYEVDGSKRGPDKTIGMYALSQSDQASFKTEVSDSVAFLKELDHSSSH
jgi:hypothetical protein